MPKSSGTHSFLSIASRRPFLTSLTGSVLLVLCFPPVGWWPLAWLAMVPWMALIAVKDFEAKKPLRSIWFSGLLYWAVEVYYISIPHPLLWIAWGLLFVYLSVYPLLFVWVTRKLVHGQRVSIVIAAPLVFTALEWVRAHLMTGFGFSMLANSQYRQAVILQICDVGGAYGLTFLMVMFSACVFLILINRRRIYSVVTAALVLSLVAGYGIYQLKRYESIEGKPFAIAVMQGNVDTRFPNSQAEMDAYQEQLFEEYLSLQKNWMEQKKQSKEQLPELIIWPEGKYPIPDVLSGGERRHETFRQAFSDYHRTLYADLISSMAPRRVPPKMIVGTSTWDPDADKDYNSALLLNEWGRVESRYFKMQRVVFGEYTPLEEWFPSLKKMTPIGAGINAGQRPTAFTIGPYVAAPNVCFESAVSHLVRESISYLDARDETPDMIVNITDDGWFYGHAVLDHHLACNVMRAVENRKPMIVAANTGLSAMIQSTGEILKQGPRGKSEVLEMEMPLKPDRSIYSLVGDWPPIAMTIICVIAIILPARKSGGL